MKHVKASVFIYLLLQLFERSQCNPISGFAPHLLAAHPFMHPAMMPLYPLQYPAFPMQPQMGSLDDMQQASASQPLSTGSSGTTSKDGSKAEEEDDDANKRDDEETFWEAASSYGKNRWTNFKDGFTELWDVFKAAGRGFKNVFGTSE